MLLTLPEIKTKVDQLAEIIGASQDILPTYGYSKHECHPHIDIGSQGYYYLIFERDDVLDRLITKDIDELLYKIFANVTEVLSRKYISTLVRLKNQDIQRIEFEYQVELLSKISPVWAERESQKHEKILEQIREQHPFYDYASILATLTKHLREKGYFQKIASELPDKQNPLQKDSKM